MGRIRHRHVATAAGAAAVLGAAAVVAAAGPPHASRAAAAALAAAVSPSGGGTRPGTAASAAAAAATAAAWRIVPAPRLAANNALDDVVATGPNAAWAVGTEGFNASKNVPGAPIILRWNGHRWAIAYKGSWRGGIFAVAAQSATSAWALGSTDDGMHQHLLHWNGHSWRETAFPGKANTFYGNLGLTAAAGHAWIIAITGSQSSQIFGWDGRSWREQHYSCALNCTLYAIKARTANDVWAVGSYLKSFTTGSALALHWNGTSWRTVPMPYVEHSYLTGGFASSASSAWAAGAIFGTNRSALFRWNGKVWRTAAVPSGMTAPPLGETTRITGDAHGRLWLAGVGLPGNRVVYFRYNGRAWSRVLGAAVANQTGAQPNAIAAVPGTSATWSVGVAFAPGLNARGRIELTGALH